MINLINLKISLKKTCPQGKWNSWVSSSINRSMWQYLILISAFTVIARHNMTQAPFSHHLVDSVSLIAISTITNFLLIWTSVGIDGCQQFVKSPSAEVIWFILIHMYCTGNWLMIIVSQKTYIDIVYISLALFVYFLQSNNIKIKLGIVPDGW